MADAHGSGPCTRKGVEVQILSPASPTSAGPHGPALSLCTAGLLGGRGLSLGVVHGERHGVAELEVGHGAAAELGGEEPVEVADQGHARHPGVDLAADFVTEVLA